MKNKLVLYSLVLGVLLVAAFFAYGSLSGNYIPETSETDGKPADSTDITPAPDFSVEDEDGNIVHLSDFKGKPVVINFWATWCGPCKTELPYFDSVMKQYGDRVEFMMVNLTDGVRETVDGAKRFVADSGYGFNIYFDTENDVGKKYYLGSIPLTVFVDRNGNIYSGHVGVISEIALKSIVNKLAEFAE